MAGVGGRETVTADSIPGLFGLELSTVAVVAVVRGVKMGKPRLHYRSALCPPTCSPAQFSLWLPAASCPSGELAMWSCPEMI